VAAILGAAARHERDEEWGREKAAAAGSRRAAASAIPGLSAGSNGSYEAARSGGPVLIPARPINLDGTIIFSRPREPRKGGRKIFGRRTQRCWTVRCHQAAPTHREVPPGTVT
jgi:hypothetical protein